MAKRGTAKRGMATRAASCAVDSGSPGLWIMGSWILTAHPNPVIFLASASPRRRILLDQLGVRHLWGIVDVDETWLPGEPAERYTVRLALAKARAGRLAQPRLPVLAADTAVVLDEEIMGKPRDRAHGLAMLANLSGRSHRVLSAVALVAGEREASRLSVSTVSFRVMSEAERLAYWDTGEPADKAGGYAIQGRAAAFVAHLAGSYSGVMGLPLYETAQLLEEFGIALWTGEN